MVLAGLDLGTNTFRCLVARVAASGKIAEELYSEQKIIRLGEGLRETGMLQPRPIARAVDALKGYRIVIDRYGVDGIVAVATSAVREASNGPEFVRTVHDRAGIDIGVISAEEEARCTFMGVLAGFQEMPQSLLVVDIGGGSTEFMWGDQKGLSGILPTDLGVVKLTEQYPSAQFGSHEEKERLAETIQQRLDGLKQVLSTSHRGGFRPAQFVGTAGTITTLAAIDQALTIYDPKRIHLYRLDVETVGRIHRMLSAKVPAERLSIPGLEKGREDLILPGSLILLMTMRFLEFPKVIVSDYGLREGILVNRASNKVIKLTGREG